ncbi:hypothetical protein KYB31_00160 [Clostridium felsineum]|uniref:hypothetical protein n=1 Tax=Clostridium felsineum TaxID=36839 RepID=UPI00098CD4DE|nr:hypothetical protein [Clostridium felsineum]MCR3757403.1 hypothetical protein [Clostridium felsineum]URZ02978.1 hypothetical protein CLAUR_030240 [Clostridium felsineum]
MKVGNKKLVLFIIGILVLTSYLSFNVFRHLRNAKIINRTVDYLRDDNDRQENLKAAIELNGGNAKNTCVFFASGALRHGGLKVPLDTANTTQLTKYLISKGFKKYYNLKELKVGDVCFTAPNGDKDEVPDHTYIFMGWVDLKCKDGYVCDNQKKGYGNSYHKRNITYETTINNEKKSIAIYYMR